MDWIKQQLSTSAQLREDFLEAFEKDIKSPLILTLGIGAALFSLPSKDKEIVGVFLGMGLMLVGGVISKLSLELIDETIHSYRYYRSFVLSKNGRKSLARNSIKAIGSGAIKAIGSGAVFLAGGYFALLSTSGDLGGTNSWLPQDVLGHVRSEFARERAAIIKPANKNSGIPQP